MSSQLLNVVLPLFIAEWWFVILAFIFVVAIETIVLCIFLQERFWTVISWVFRANAISTLGGYIIQSLVRFVGGVAIFVSTGFGVDSWVWAGIAGNIGLGLHERGWKSPIILLNFSISIAIAFIISIAIEARLIFKYSDEVVPHDKLKIAVIVSNLISYVFFTWWLLYAYQNTRGGTESIKLF